MYSCIPLVMFYRCLVKVCSCCFRQREQPVYSFPETLRALRRSSGGWYRDVRRAHVSVRDSFYIFLVQKLQQDVDVVHLAALLRKMAKTMTNDGQVAWCFCRTWFADSAPMYKHKGVQVVDANMQFIIMTWWLYGLDPDKGKSLYLYCQRAWQWLDIHIANDAVHEPIGASWEDSRHHTGTLLLSNIQLIQTLRCMELLHIVEQDKRKQHQFKQRHDRAVSTWMPEIYKTQETLPRILAVCFNIVPKTFVKSFNQEIQSAWIPCRVQGPVDNVATRDAWIYGYADKHDSLVWPWIGFLWILVLHVQHEHELAKAWWTSYMDFHEPDNLYDVYDPETGRPVRRAFLKGHAEHALTIATWMAAKHAHVDDLI